MGAPGRADRSGPGRRHTRFRTLDARKANEDELEAMITAWTLQRDRWELTRQLQASGVAAFPSLTCKDLIEDARLNERGYIERLEHSVVDARAHAGVPWRHRSVRTACGDRRSA